MGQCVVVKAERLLEKPDGLSVSAARVSNRAKAVVALGIVWLELDGAAEVRLRVVEPVRLQKHNAELIVLIGGRGCEGERPLKLGDRIVKSSIVEIALREIPVQAGIIRTGQQH